MKQSVDLSKILQSKTSKSQKNIAIIGSSKGSGASTITNFLYKNYGVKPDGDLKIQELEQGRLSLVLEDESIINIDNTNSHFCDKEGVIIVIDITQKGIDSKILIPILTNIQKYKLNVVWFINKIDKAIFDMEKKNSEEVYQLLVEKIDQINQSIELVNNDEATDYIEELNPQRGNVLFGSAVDGWAFSLQNFAEEYSLKLKIEPSKLVNKFWGENFYDHSAKTWATNSDEKNVDNRSFCTFIFDPIWKFYLMIRQGSLDAVEDLVKQLGIKADTTNKSGRILLRIVMYAWLNSAKALLGSVQRYILNFSEGITELNRWDVFSKQLEKHPDIDANIIYCFGLDKLTGLIQGKVLRKSKLEKPNLKFNAFESDLQTGSTLKSEIEVESLFHPYYSSNHLNIQWDNVTEGQVLLIQGKSVKDNYILTDLKQIPFYKQYNTIQSDVPPTLESKNPFSIQNYLLGTFDKLNSKVASIIAEKNELFHSLDELFDFLMKKFEFTKQDISSIVAIQNDCIVFNYSNQKSDKNFSVCFENAISQSNLRGTRIDIESINKKGLLNDEQLTKALCTEFLAIAQ